MATRKVLLLRRVSILAALVFLAAILVSASPGLPAARRAQVAYVKGEVKIDGAAADLGVELPSLVLVETGVGARVDLVFGGGNVLSVGQNTRARFDFASPTINIKLERGGVTSVLKKLEKLVDKVPFNVSTQLAVAAVRGTSFCVWCDADSTYVCACNGRVGIEDAEHGNRLDLAAAHHVARVYSRQEGKYRVSEAGLLHHDDSTVESAAKTIGATIDWTKIDG